MTYFIEIFIAKDSVDDGIVLSGEKPSSFAIRETVIYDATKNA
jgi:hypothetical protein